MREKEVSFVKNNYINYINTIISNGKVSHAYIIEIDDYDNDLLYVYDFIKMILLNISYEKLKSSTDSIISQIDNENYPDIKIIEPDGNFIKKNQLLDLQRDFSNKSLLDNKRIYVIKYADKLNLSSANTILKFLEEPEDNIIALLLTDNRYHIIDTILSRCQILSLKEESFKIEEEDIVDLLKVVLCPRDFFIKYRYFVNDYLVDKNNAKEKFSLINKIIIEYLNSIFYSSNFVDNSAFVLLKKIDNSILLKYLIIIDKKISELEFNINYKLWIDSLFSKLIMEG